MSTTTCANQRIDAALEKNLETMRIMTTTQQQPTQLTQNDLQLFDSTREMTPDSINEEPSVPVSSNPNVYVWPPGNVYPFAHQHPGFYMPYLTPTNNGLPPFYPSLIDPQSFSAYVTQQQAAARFFQEQASLSGSSTRRIKEKSSTKYIFR